MSIHGTSSVTIDRLPTCVEDDVPQVFLGHARHKELATGCTVQQWAADYRTTARGPC
jgi:hypothetical protein